MAQLGGRRSHRHRLTLVNRIFFPRPRLRRWFNSISREQRATVDQSRRLASEEIGRVSGVRAARHAWFAADRESRESTRKQRWAPLVDGESPLAPRGTSACASRKEARTASPASSPGRRAIYYGVRDNGAGTRAPVRKESVETENADGTSARARRETHLIIARFRHLAPALNNALSTPLTHYCRRFPSVLCARRWVDGTERSMARLIPRAGIISRCVRRVASAPCPPPYGAASHVAPPRVTTLRGPRDVGRDLGVVGSRRGRDTIGDRPRDRLPISDAKPPRAPSHALPHGRMNERRAALANKMRKRPHSTAPDQRLTETAGPIAARGACADPRPSRPTRARAANRRASSSALRNRAPIAAVGGTRNSPVSPGILNKGIFYANPPFNEDRSCTSR